MSLHLSERSAEYWARDASIDELREAAFASEPLNDDAAERLDFAYQERCLQIVGRKRSNSREDALGLADVIERAAHDTVRADLDKLSKPYFARWRALAEMLHRYASRLAGPSPMLDRAHVREILLHLHRAGGSAPQSELSMIENPGQRSVTLKLMEHWELVERRADGRQQIVELTDLGRLQIADEIAKPAPTPSSVPRGVLTMTTAV